MLNQMFIKFVQICIAGGTKASFRQYHVLFFGNEGERGWVVESSTHVFEGRVAFEKFCQRMIKEHKKDKKNYQVIMNNWIFRRSDRRAGN